MKRIKKNDTVIITTGKNKGYIGKVISCTEDKVIVEGANLVSKCVKPNPNIGQEGGIIRKESSIHISNVAIYNEKAKKASKVGFKYVEDANGKKKVRYFKIDNEQIDL